MMSQRAFYSIDEEILDGFNRLVPATKRSKLVQKMMAKYVAQNDSLIEQAARQIEADPSYNSIMTDVAAFADDVLNRLRDE
jgi:metal-responsive CopG/Arc/MetJ family transcriptional regulator